VSVDCDDTPLSDKCLGRQLLEAAVQRQIHCPYTNKVLDARRAVLLDGTHHGHAMHIMTAEVWDRAENAFFEAHPRDEFDVYDGRDLYG